MIFHVSIDCAQNVNTCNCNDMCNLLKKIGNFLYVTLLRYLRCVDEEKYINVNKHFV